MKINGFFHYGVSVPNLDKAIVFFQEIFGLEAFQLRNVQDKYLSLLVNSGNASAKIAMFKLGENAFLEILEWEAGDRSELLKHNLNREQETLTTVGVQHLCVYVDNALEIFELLSKNCYAEMISPHPVEIPFGPNKGALVFFVKVFKVLYLEIFQKSSQENI